LRNSDHHPGKAVIYDHSIMSSELSTNSWQQRDFRVCIVSASGQNIFFAELLDAIEDALRATGLAVERSVDRFPLLQDDLVYVFVPHEYTPLVETDAHPTDEYLSRSVVISTEQPGTSWFDEDVHMASRAAATVDINPLGVRELKRRGVKAALLRLGYIPAWDTWGGSDSGERPIDVVFMGGYTTRRGRALARCSSTLVDRRTELVLTETHYPHLEDSSAFLSGAHRWSVLRQSKLMVNVHRSELGYLEWVRAIGAMLNGCVLLSEHSIGFGPLVPNEHFVSVSYDGLPLAVDALLANPERLARIRKDAYHFLRKELPISSTIEALVKATETAASKRVQRGVIASPPTMPLPRSPARPPTEYERIVAHRSDLDRVRGALKDLVLGQMALRRQVGTLLDRLDGVTREDMVERFGPHDTPVRVSVILTVYNYADVVHEAIGSVGASNGASYELIVVDDCSTDSSLVAIREALASCTWVPATVIACGHNRGLAAARNYGIEHARGEFVFILDADNMIYPHALERLIAALDNNRHASFAYGIIEQFGPEGPRDLMSWQHWDPERLRYGNYIDAMAMIRRDALICAGRYTLDPRLHGWEDYALWCKFGNLGLHGVRVTEILSRYRSGVASMISTTNIDVAAAWGALVDQSPFLISEPQKR
jgi:glycosyl transferase family 2